LRRRAGLDLCGLLLPAKEICKLIHPLPILRRALIIKVLLLSAGATYGFEAGKRPKEGSPWTPLSS
jgi:hypothetical protein